MIYKRFISLFLAVSVCCTFLVVPSFANGSGMIKDISRFVSDVSVLFEQVANDDISQSEFFNKFKSSMVRFDINFVADVTCFKDVLKVFEFCGVDVPDKWEEWFYENKMGGAGGAGNRDDSALEGWGATMTTYFYSNIWTTFCDYGELYYAIYDDGSKHLKYRICGNATERRCFPDGSLNGYYNPNVSGEVPSDAVLLGDWRWINPDDETDGIISDLPELKPPNLEDAEEDDLIDFFRDLLDELLLQYPDLSNVEGLLRAILVKLGTLDSDDDNEVLCSILTAIQALEGSGGSESDNSELLKLLEELKNSVVFEDDEKTSTLAEQLNSLVDNQISLSDITIDESLYNQRFNLIQTKLLGKFSFISELKSFIEYALNAYSSSTSPSISFSFLEKSYTIDFSAFDGSIDSFRFLLAAFSYLSYAFITFRKIPGYINGGDNT